ncbi:MAG: SDR family NAD(P)-dependent oxidoreductase [Desulfovibrio sp.]
MIDWSTEHVLVTGGCGTIGRELVRQLVHELDVKSLTAIDNNESELFFDSENYRDQPNVQFFLGDIRDRLGLSRRMQGVDTVFHTAAFKHVILCEKAPMAAVQTNIDGVSNVIWAALTAHAKRVVFTSSDKAVNPTNVMGTSKLMGERLITAANADSGARDCVFFSTRFGNVLGSRGSVIPLFKRQIAKGGPITLTDPEMTRFIMSVKQAVRLVIDSASLSRGGEVLVTKMPVVRIVDLAEVMIQELAPRYGHAPEEIRIQVIGPKPGEKFYEELMTGEETRRALELERYFVIKPAFLPHFRKINYDFPVPVLSEHVTRPYNSADEPIMERSDLRAFLLENGLLELE